MAVNEDETEGREISSQFAELENFSEFGQVMIYMSVISLSVNDSCRAAMTHAIFFSKDHLELRESVAGVKLFRKTFMNNPLLVPNGPNWIPDQSSMPNFKQSEFDGSRWPKELSKTACPNFVDSWPYFDLEEGPVSH